VSDAKRRAWRFGRWAETGAALSIRCRGYRIVARRFKCPVGEIDIVAQRGNVLSFMEVKARQDLSTAAESLGPRQIQRITRAAEAFLMQRPEWADCDIRFDMILVRPWRLPVHVKDAWRPER